MVVATCIETPTKFRRYTVANATAIPLGTLLKLTDPNTAIATSASADPFAGIAWEEKTASDGITEITAAVNGTWDIECTAAALNAGAIVCVGGANAIRVAIAAELLTGTVVGKSMETTTTTETIRVAVGEVV